MSRYDRLLELSSFSKEKLQLLQSKKVLIVGVGGVGQYIACSLVTNGIEQLSIVDFDVVEMSNLNRQILLNEEDINQKKVLVVKKALYSKNHDAKINTLDLKVDESNVLELIKDHDVIVDAVDNWKTKLILSNASFKLHKPLLHVGVDGEKGQYCLFTNKSLLDVVSNDVLSEPRDGVMGPMVGVLSSLAALELLRYLSNENIKTDVMYHFDLNNHKLVKINL